MTSLGVSVVSVLAGCVIGACGMLALIAALAYRGFRRQW